MNRSTFSFLSALCAAALLAACGGGSSSDPLQPYREQALQWAPCDATILGEDAGELLDGLKAQCAQMRAPLDYARPDRGDISVAVMRIAATDPAKRRGALFFNPGGPGGDGLALTPLLHTIFAGSNPEDPQGALQLRLLQEYDMIGFSPRGTGASTTLTCATNELRRQVDWSAAGRHAPGNVENMLYNGRKMAEACLKNPLTPYVNTEATAQDMDLLRGLLGDGKISYLGYSYGTWLGSWYARRFPDRVDRMVLDSNMDFSNPIDATALLQAQARQRVLDDVLSRYAARHQDYFNLGDAQAVRTAAAALQPALQPELGSLLSGASYKRKNADLMLLALNAAHGLDQTLKALPQATPEQVHEALDAHTFLPANPALESQAKEMAHQLYARVLARPHQAMRSIVLEPDDAVFWAVRCNDSPTRTEPAYWIATGDAYAARFPLFGTRITEHLCAFWGGPRVSAPALQPMQSLDVLMVQSQYDAATATEGAKTAFDALPEARGVYVPEEFQHGLYPYQDRCVDGLVTRHLLGEAPRERLSTCPAHPLAQDARQAQPPAGAKAQGGSAYRDPEAAQRLIDRFKDGIGRAAPPR